jgi:hypothetical protein
MNYIHQLQQRVAELEQDKSDARDGVMEMLTYLHSSKFHNDTTVQTSDIFLRLEPIQRATM